MAGWRIEKSGKTILACEHLPNRARGVLCAVNGNEHRVIASFNCDESEKIFTDIMQEICENKKV